MIDLEAQQGQLFADFNENGYVSIPGFLSADEVSEANAHMKRVIDGVVPTLPPEVVFYEDKSRPETLKQIQKLFDHDPHFKKMMFGSKFERLASTLLREPVVPQNMQYFNKPPGIGLPTPPHQDGYFFMLHPNHAVTMWLALEDVGYEQGCVRYVRGSHRYGMRAHANSGVLGFSQHILDYGIPFDRDNEVAFPCEAGHLIVHHALTIHRADGNTSTDKTRKALGFIYYGKSAKADEKAAEAYQKQLAQELAAQGKI